MVTGPLRPPGRGAWVTLLAALLFGVATDLGSKWAAFRWIAGAPVTVSREAVLSVDHLGALLPPHNPVVVIPSVLDLTLVLNPGAVFGIGAGQRWLFIGFTLLAVVFSLWIFLKWTTAQDRLAHLALGLLLSGGIGNLYDRLRFACVRDFLHPLPGVRLPWGITWPNGSDEVWPYVSNLADLWLIVGIAVLLVYSWRKPGHHEAGERVEADEGG
ncbi:MAG: signal peptidase II [Phycisphaeraceae bacterium]|nr:MAG: signal peptidase II [Phycisphaeraceae bacterium]